MNPCAIIVTKWVTLPVTAQNQTRPVTSVANLGTSARNVIWMIERWSGRMIGREEVGAVVEVVAAGSMTGEDEVAGAEVVTAVGLMIEDIMNQSATLATE